MREAGESGPHVNHGIDADSSAEGPAPHRSGPPPPPPAVGRVTMTATIMAATTMLTTYEAAAVAA